VDSALAAAELRVRRVELAMQSGAADRVDEVAARLDSLEAATAQVDARLALAEACGNLDDAVQSPWGVDPGAEPVRTAAATDIPSAEAQR
jgi:hypothetical protein